ncbi:MAG TPA: TlpA disulfide reductase family protein [Solirubrobacteraceae bacterium]|jgi:cytochrome c biogenesis protein CcmG/thiol:disulfide interchange protein DsbE
MRRFLLPGLVVVAAVALLALLAVGVSNQTSTSSIDAQVARGTYPTAPSLSVALPVLGSKRSVTLADYRGKVVVLNVFASWCDPCKAEAPILADAERTLRAHDATILGVTYLDNSSASEQFVRQEHITYPVLRDVSGDFVRSFGTTGVPETFVINRQGRIQALRRYQLNTTWLKQTLPRILAERS